MQLFNQYCQQTAPMLFLIANDSNISNQNQTLHYIRCIKPSVNKLTRPFPIIALAGNTVPLEEMWQRWRAVSDTFVFNLTCLRFDPQAALEANALPLI